MVDRPSPPLFYSLLVLLAVLFFVLDWLVPSSLTVEMLQVAIVLLTLFVDGRRPTLIFGGIASFFVVGGYAIHVYQNAPLAVLANHGIVLMGLWGAVAVVLAYKRVLRTRRESEARAQAVLETTVDGIITIDRNGTIESFNQAAEDIFGYDAEEVIGKNVKVLMPSPYREEHDEYLRSYHETGERNIIGIGREVTGRRKDGSTFPMDLAVSEVELGDRTIYTGIVRDISERRRMEKEILNVSEQERRRIGQDLHDGLGQMLTGIGLLSQDVARHLEEEGHDRADDMAEITEHIKEADQYARDLSHGLIPVDVDSNGLPEALRRLAQNAERLFDVDCEFEEIETARVHDSTTASHLYRIAQEAVNNAVRHGEADRIRLALASGDEQIRLQVRDDGSGFEEDDTADGDGMGVNIMNYRARIIGGTLEISSALGEGTVVTCTLPRRAYANTTGDGEPAAPVE
jgi:two-component system sensor kinase FixL